MKIQSLTIGLSVRHPQYGVGTVKTISEQTAEIRFNDALRTIEPDLSGLVPAEPGVAVSGLEMPLGQFVASTIESVIERLGFEKPEAVVGELGVRWHKGKMVLHPSGSGVAGQGSAAGGFLPQAGGHPESVAGAGTKSQRPPRADGRRQGGDAAIRHALLRVADDVQPAVQGQGRAVFLQGGKLTGGSGVKNSPARCRASI